MTSESSLDAKVLGELFDIGRDLTSNLDFADIVDKVGESAKRALGADIAVCYLYDQETDRYALETDIGSKRAPTLDRVPRPAGPTATIIKTGKPLISNDAQKEETPYRGSPFTLAEGVRSVLGLPLRKGDEIVGVLYINYRKPNMITQNVRRIGELLASQAAIAIFNARLFRQLLEREESLSRLVTIEQNISKSIAKSHLTKVKSIVKLVLDEIARAACELLKADCATFYPYDSTREAYYDLENVGYWGLQTPLELNDKPRTSGGMSGYVRQEGRIIRNDVASEDPNMLKSRFIAREKIQAFIGISVQTENTHLAVLYVSFRKPRSFAKDEIHLVELFAHQAGIFLQIARVLEQEQMARTNLEMLGLLNNIGSALSHRVVGIVGTTPIQVRQIRRRLIKLNVEDLDVEQSLSSIEGDTTRLMEMAASLKKLSELMGSSEPTDVNSIASSVLESINQVSIQKETSYSPELPLTNIPQPQLKEVLFNIIRNAVDHMQGGGRLVLSTRLSNDRQWIEVDISDTGSGMDKPKQGKIFELFYSEKKGGLGFGLWWSRTFMRRISGDISVKSELGKGSTFTVIIPIITS